MAAPCTAACCTGEWPPAAKTHGKRAVQEVEASAHQTAIGKLQVLLKCCWRRCGVRPRRSTDTWSVGEKLHLVLHQWLRDEYPLRGVLTTEKAAKASEKWKSLQ